MTDPTGEAPVEQTMSIPVTAAATPVRAVDEVVAELGLEPLRSGTAMIVVRRGPNAGARFLLDTDLVGIGRHPDSAVFLDDVTVSRRHAEIRRRPGGHLVRDVGSLNGTYVNRDRVDEVGLVHGDEIQVGKYRLLFVSGDATAGDREAATGTTAPGESLTGQGPVGGSAG